MKIWRSDNGKAHPAMPSKVIIPTYQNNGKLYNDTTVNGRKPVWSQPVAID